MSIITIISIIVVALSCTVFIITEVESNYNEDKSLKELRRWREEIFRED